MSKNVSESKTVAISKELDYAIKQSSHPTYKFSRLTPLEGAGDITITPTGTTETRIEIPTKCINFAESILRFTATVGAVAGRYTWFFTDTFPFIQSIRLETRSGVMIADITHLQNYIKIVRKKETKFEEFLTYDDTEALFRNNCAAGTAFGASQGDTKPNNTSSTMSYTEARYLYRSALNTAYTSTMQFPLSAIKNTIFALSKDLMFPEIITLRITWSPGQKIMFTGTDVADPTTGAAAIATNITISNCNLYLAVEQDQSIIDALAAKIKTGGLALPIPYLWTYQSVLNGTSHNISFRMTAGQGMNVQKIISTVFNSTESSNTAYDCHNVNGAKISSYYSQLDGNRMQEFNIDCTALDDWLLHKKMLRGSVMQNYEVYAWDWFHCDDFTNQGAPCESKTVDDSNLVAGLDLSTERRYDLTMTTANASYAHYVYVVFTRMLMIGANDVVVK